MQIVTSIFFFFFFSDLELDNKISKAGVNNEKTESN